MSPDVLRLVLARHGQTEANVAHLLDTRPPGWPLNELGRAQAEALADSLADRPLRAVYASTALRAQQTAQPVAARHGIAAAVIDGVQEVAAGNLELRGDDEALQSFRAVGAAWRAGRLDAALPGGESAAEVQARFLAAVQKITAEHPAGDVVLVSHGAAIRLAAAALLGDTVETQYVPNAGRVLLATDPAAPTGWRLESWDSAPAVPGDVTAGGLA